MTSRARQERTWNAKLISNSCMFSFQRSLFKLQTGTVSMIQISNTNCFYFLSVGSSRNRFYLSSVVRRFSTSGQWLAPGPGKLKSRPFLLLENSFQTRREAGNSFGLLAPTSGKALSSVVAEYFLSSFITILLSLSLSLSLSLMHASITITGHLFSIFLAQTAPNIGPSLVLSISSGLPLHFRRTSFYFHCHTTAGLLRVHCNRER